MWFFVGMQINIRRAQGALRWMQDGLPLLGQKTTLRWLGTTGVDLGINAAREPFKSIEILVLQEPRDVVLLWWLAHRQGRRDMMIVRGHLRRHALVQFDLVDPKSPSGKQTLADVTPDNWERKEWAEGLVLAAESAEASSMAGQLLPYLGRVGPRLMRASVRRTVPHVEIHVTAPWGQERSAEDVFRAVKEIGQQLLPAQSSSDTNARPSG